MTSEPEKFKKTNRIFSKAEIEPISQVLGIYGTNVLVNIYSNVDTKYKTSEFDYESIWAWGSDHTMGYTSATNILGLGGSLDPLSHDEQGDQVAIFHAIGGD